MKSIASTSNISLAWYKKALITIFAFNYGCPTICATDQRQVTKNSGHPLVVDQEAYTSLWTTNANRIFGMCDWSTLLVLSCHLAEEFGCSPFVACLSQFTIHDCIVSQPKNVWKYAHVYVLFFL